MTVDQANQLADTYLDAAISMGGTLNQIWGFYCTVLLAVLGGVILSPSLRPPQPLVRVVLILAGVAAFLVANFVAVATNSARLDYLLRLVQKYAPEEPASLTVFQGPLAFLSLQDNPFSFNYTPMLMAHLGMDACLLFALAWVLMTDGRNHAR